VSLSQASGNLGHILRHIADRSPYKSKQSGKICYEKRQFALCLSRRDRAIDRLIHGLPAISRPNQAIDGARTFTLKLSTCSAQKKLPGLFRLREQFSQLQLHFTTCFNSADVLLSQFAFPA
jgi:hypothetical protein